MKWWDADQDTTYRDIALVPKGMIDRIPDVPVETDNLPGYDNRKPLFVGHYWMTGRPALLTSHIACLDYSVAAKAHGRLCAYRWDGEQQLSADKLIWVT